MTADLKAHADRLRELHHAEEMLVLPNVWDAASAKIVAEAGFPVVATASAAISAMLGYPVGDGAHAERLAAIRAAAGDAGAPIVINARADTFLPGSGVPGQERVAEAVRRGRLYLGAGADCIYPIGVSDERDIATLVAEMPGPINGNTRPGGP